jgi:hypothetical protein
VQVLDLATRNVSIFPGSEGFYVGSWSPYNVQVHSWGELKKFDVPWGYWVWTPDSEGLLFAQTEQAKGIYRLTITNREWERIAGLDGVNVADQVNEAFLNLTADGQPAIMNDTSVVQTIPCSGRMSTSAAKLPSSFERGKVQPEGIVLEQWYALTSRW